jgi:hypothetical protein
MRLRTTIAMANLYSTPTTREGMERLKFKRNGANVTMGEDYHLFKWEGMLLVLKGHSVDSIKKEEGVEVYPSLMINGTKVHSDLTLGELQERGIV